MRLRSLLCECGSRKRTGKTPRFCEVLLEDRFPRVWVPSLENRDLRQLLWHRHRLVQIRTRILNQLQSVAMSEVYSVAVGCGTSRAKNDWNSYH
jgi:transposase